MFNVAIIPARAGSNRLKNKNRRKINGISLINWSINFAKKLNFLDHIVVTTDDKVILKELKKKNSSIKIIKRPKYLAKKRSRSEDVIIHAINNYEKKFGKVDTILLLQPTSPIRSLKHVNAAFRKFNYFKKKKSIVSVFKSSSLSKRNFKIYNNNLILQNDEKKTKYQIDGNFYFATPTFIKKYKSFYRRNKTYPMITRSKKFSIDIDTIQDFKIAKNYLER